MKNKLMAQIAKIIILILLPIALGLSGCSEQVNFTIPPQETTVSNGDNLTESAASQECFVAPLKAKLFLSGAPSLSQTAELTCKVFSKFGVSDIIVQVVLPHGLVLVSGNLSWQGSIAANQTIEFKTTVKAVEIGNWAIIAFTKKEPQSGFILENIGVQDMLYLCIAEDITVISETPLLCGKSYQEMADMQERIAQKRSMERSMADESKIRFQSGYSFRTTPGTIEAGIQEREKIPANDYYVIQFYWDEGSVGQSARGILQQSGCVFYNSVPNYAFYIKIPPEALDTAICLVKTGKVRYLGRIPTEAKIKPELLAKAQENPDKIFKVGVLLFDKANPSQVNSLKDTMQVNTHYYDILDSVYGTATGNSIQDIIALSFVEWVEEEGISTACNNDGTSAVTETEIQQPVSKWKIFFSSLQQKIRELWHK